MEHQLVPSSLPALPVQMHSLTGSNLVQEHLILRYYNATTAEEAMSIFRSLHSAERCRHRSLFYMEPHGDMAKVYFMIDFEGRRRQIGRTVNDPRAAQLLIGNWRQGRYMTGVNWELYVDSNCDDLIEMGRFDQYDLLKGIDGAKLEELTASSIKPCGNWDFDGMLWPRQCSVCGTTISINGHFYNIDSAVCAQCGNRPFLAPNIHDLLDISQEAGYEERERMILHAFRWMGGVRAQIGQVRSSIEDRGERLRLVWGETIMGRALNSASVHFVRALLESNTQTNFDVFQACCEKVEKALTGEEPFREEHQIALDLAVRTTELIRVRLLATQVQ